MSYLFIEEMSTDDSTNSYTAQVQIHIILFNSNHDIRADISVECNNNIGRAL